MDIKCCVDEYNIVQIYVDGIKQPMFYDERDKGYVTEIKSDIKHTVVIERKSLLQSNLWILNVVNSIADLFNSTRSNFNEVYDFSLEFQIADGVDRDIIIDLSDDRFIIDNIDGLTILKNEIYISKNSLFRWKTTNLISCNVILLIFSAIMLFCFFTSGVKSIFSYLYLCGAIFFVIIDIVFINEILKKYSRYKDIALDKLKVKEYEDFDSN